MNVILNTHNFPNKIMYSQSGSLERSGGEILSRSLPSFSGCTNVSLVVSSKTPLIRRVAARLAKFVEKTGIAKICPFEACPLGEIAKGIRPEFKLKQGKFLRLKRLLSFIKK